MTFQFGSLCRIKQMAMGVNGAALGGPVVRLIAELFHA